MRSLQWRPSTVIRSSTMYVLSRWSSHLWNAESGMRAIFSDESPGRRVRGFQMRSSSIASVVGTALRVRSREGVAHGVHQLVEAVAALARPGPAVEDDLAHEVVEEIAAPDEGRGREAARNRGSLDVGGLGVLELSP